MGRSGSGVLVRTSFLVFVFFSHFTRLTSADPQGTGLFAPKTNICSRERLPGTFAPWNFRSHQGIDEGAKVRLQPGAKVPLSLPLANRAWN